VLRWLCHCHVLTVCAGACVSGSSRVCRLSSLLASVALKLTSGGELRHVLGRIVAEGMTVALDATSIPHVGGLQVCVLLAIPATAYFICASLYSDAPHYITTASRCVGVVT
jgi:hypothetical protein